MKEEKAIIRKATYLIEHIEYEDGSVKLRRTCDGFDAYQLMGLLELAQIEIKDQLKGMIKADVIERIVINDTSPTHDH
jgi:hypothetical protein